jgi:DNA recombination protein RmuC
VDQVWRLEKQRGILNDVFDAIRKIYEKYVNFAEDMQRIDDQLQKAREAYADAYKKLATGDGNLLRQMEKFRKENIIKPKKLPPAAFQESDAAPPEP